jgi:hypothetical protein
VRISDFAISISFGELGNEADLSLKAFIICPGLAM